MMREIPAIAVLATIPTVAGELLFDERLVGMLVGLGIALTGLIVEYTRRYRVQTALLELEARAARASREAEAQAQPQPDEAA